ncbi:hypothetical protein [Ensifer aridi]|uniref:hypothetical protein n=1 Tax=Ensifer aridi TaxID=1708715 RepID=UPI000A0F546A|nr:hypothetical protein [Ensifer aridi]
MRSANVIAYPYCIAEKLRKRSTTRETQLQCGADTHRGRGDELTDPKATGVQAGRDAGEASKLRLRLSKAKSTSMA